MARLILLLLLAAGCDDETTAFSLDLTVTLDLSMSACAGGTGGSCNTYNLDWCQPTPSSQNICLCAHPAQRWYCCDVGNWACPPSPRTGDFCCPQPSGYRQCGACSCIDGQFVCNGDAGAHD